MKSASLGLKRLWLMLRNCVMIMLLCNCIELDINGHLSDEPTRALLDDNCSYTRLYVLKLRVDTSHIFSNFLEAVDQKLCFR